MIKNKTLYIEIIFKIYLKILKTFQVSNLTFVLQNIRKLLSKIVTKQGLNLCHA